MSTSNFIRGDRIVATHIDTTVTGLDAGATGTVLTDQRPDGCLEVLWDNGDRFAVIPECGDRVRALGVNAAFPTPTSLPELDAYWAEQGTGAGESSSTVTALAEAVGELSRPVAIFGIDDEPAVTWCQAPAPLDPRSLVRPRHDAATQYRELCGRLNLTWAGFATPGHNILATRAAALLGAGPDPIPIRGRCLLAGVTRMGLAGPIPQAQAVSVTAWMAAAGIDPADITVTTT